MNGNCIHGIGHGESDEKGTRVGVTCMKDGKECVGQCLLKGKTDIAETDEEIVALANRLQTRIEHTGYAVPEHRTDDELIVRILHDYIDKRKAAAKNGQAVGTADETQIMEEPPKTKDKDGIGNKCIRANFGGPSVPRQIEGKKFGNYDEHDVLCYAEEVHKDKTYSDKSVNLFLAEKMAERSLLNKEEAERQKDAALNADMRWIGAESRLSKVVLGLEQFYYSIDQRWTQKTVAKSDCMHYARQRIKNLIDTATNGKSEADS